MKLRYTPQRIQYENQKQQISAADYLLQLFVKLRLKDILQKLKTSQPQQLSLMDRWRIDAEISGAL